MAQRRGPEDLERWARREASKGLGEAPRLVIYLSIAVGLKPNLEQAMDFAARNARGVLGKDLGKTLREALLQGRNAEEALHEFGERWGRWDRELKRSIGLIKRSVNERREENRLRALDKALELVLHGARDRVKRFASGLHAPTLMLYSLGVLLPLMLMVALPVLLAAGVLLDPWVLLGLYCFVLPCLIWGLSRRVLAKRPEITAPLELEPEPVGKGVIAGVAGASACLGLALGLGAPSLFPLLTLWAGVVGISTYLYLRWAKPYRLRDLVKRVEEELSDCLMQLGHRLSEGSPGEIALKHLALNPSSSAEVFKRALQNIRLGLGFRRAFLDPRHGALAQTPSPMVRDLLGLVVDAVERGARAAGRAALRASEHLRALKRVEVELRQSMGELVASMRSVAVFFAPLVAGVSLKLQEALAPRVLELPFLAPAWVPSPLLTLSLGVYVGALVSTLTTYSVELEFGEDKALKRLALAQSLPLALGVFTACAFFTERLLGLLLG